MMWHFDHGTLWKSFVRSWGWGDFGAVSKITKNENGELSSRERGQVGKDYVAGKKRTIASLMPVSAYTMSSQ